jgi:hypothetical protein
MMESQPVPSNAADPYACMSIEEMAWVDVDAFARLMRERAECEERERRELLEWRASRQGDELLPIVFLDIDDVLCLSDPYGGYDVKELFAGERQDHAAVYAELFTAQGKGVLARVHTALEGKLRFVISSTWREHFTFSQMQEIMRSTGLGFVANAMFSDDRWCTERSALEPNRADEIRLWLTNYHRGEPWVVVDDTFSGWTYRVLKLDHSRPHRKRIVLCDERVGLEPQHVAPILAALREPL